MTATGLSNFDKGWSDAHFVSFLLYYYCTLIAEVNKVQEGPGFNSLLHSIQLKRQKSLPSLQMKNQIETCWTFETFFTLWVLTLSGTRQGTFICMSLLDQILSADLFKKKSNFFGGENWPPALLIKALSLYSSKSN